MGAGIVATTVMARGPVLRSKDWEFEMNEPLIYTTKGNLPIAALDQRVVWTDNEQETICASELWDGDECVRREVHIYKRTGLETLGNIGAI